ncbi:hypothetical protein N0X72_16870 [Streptomyces carpaticus]|uniref:Protein kilB n=2 Tax=Streptomyces TaxID=1883 RepID=A0A1I6P1Y8_9ACTN|nr:MULTISPECIES: hypothetical protein [Streptomyces]UWM50536.1 hypothetical protein N0X72_16870 [Streptomyces carpaticus]SFS34173.1 hypothetical protein SAMN05444716_101216 [Streptomyces harbinensis]
MDSLWTSVVAVAGTLLGSLSTHLFQRRATRSQTLRQERLVAYSAFAATLEEYRHGQNTRWHQRNEPDRTAARDEAHRLRTSARQALHRVELLTDDPALTELARNAYRSTWSISTAVEPDEHRERDGASRQAIEAFVTAAARHVR